MSRYMKRRRFVQGLLTVPAVMAFEPVLLLSQRGGPGGAAVAPPEIAYSLTNEVADPVLRFFTPEMFQPGYSARVGNMPDR